MSYPKAIEQQIRERAYEIYEYRREFNITFTTDRLGNLREITAQDDWLEAEAEQQQHAKNFHNKFNLKENNDRRQENN